MIFLLYFIGQLFVHSKLELIINYLHCSLMVLLFFVLLLVIAIFPLKFILFLIKNKLILII